MLFPLYLYNHLSRCFNVKNLVSHFFFGKNDVTFRIFHNNFQTSLCCFHLYMQVLNAFFCIHGTFHGSVQLYILPRPYMFVRAPCIANSFSMRCRANPQILHCCDDSHSSCENQHNRPNVLFLSHTFPLIRFHTTAR